MAEMCDRQEEIEALFCRLGLLNEVERKKYVLRDVEPQREITTETSNITYVRMGEENA